MLRRTIALALALPLAIAPLLAAAAPHASAAPHRRPLEERDLRTLVTLLDPQIAPDGGRIAMIVRRPDFAKNAYANELVLVNARTGATRTLVAERKDVQNPRWSPAGDRIAYVATPPKDSDAKDEPAPQLYLLRLDGGEPARITDAKHGVDAFAWRPDGRGFAYLTRDDAPDEKRIKAHDDWFEITDDAWTAHAAAVPHHLWTVDNAGKRARRVTEGTWSLNGEPAFVPDGRSVYVNRTPHASTNRYREHDVVRIDLAARTVREVAPQHAGDAIVSPDGKRLAYAGEDAFAPSQTELYVSDLDGRHAHDLSARLDRNVQFAAFIPHGGDVVVGANDRTRDRLFALSPNGTPRALPLADVDLNGNATASRDGTLAFIGITPSHPSELYVLRANARAPQRLSRYNDAVAAHLMAARARSSGAASAASPRTAS